MSCLTLVLLHVIHEDRLQRLQLHRLLASVVRHGCCRYRCPLPAAAAARCRCCPQLRVRLAYCQACLGRACAARSAAVLTPVEVGAEQRERQRGAADRASAHGARPRRKQAAPPPLWLLARAMARMRSVSDRWRPLGRLPGACRLATHLSAACC